MDCMSFISSLAKSLAWPVTTLMILYHGKDDILKFLKSIKSLKYDKFELEIEILANDLAEEARAFAEDEQAQPKSDQYQDFDTGNAFETLIKTYSTLEQELKDTLAKKMDSQDIDLKSVTSINGRTVNSKNIPIPTVLSALTKGKIIDEEFVKIFKDIRSLRNIVVHDAKYHISDEAAKKVILSSISLINILKKA